MTEKYVPSCHLVLSRLPRWGLNDLTIVPLIGMDHSDRHASFVFVFEADGCRYVAEVPFRRSCRYSHVFLEPVVVRREFIFNFNQ